MEYIEFESPIRELEEQLKKTKQLQTETGQDLSRTMLEIEKSIISTRKDIQKNLSPWQKVQLSRHPSRPYTLAYIQAITNGNFLELHGDRGVKDDKAMVG